MGLFSSQIPTKRMVLLCRQLATAYEAGIPIIQSLDLVRDQFKDHQVKSVLTDMSDQIRQGATLADSAAAQSKHLPMFLIQLLAAGERGGRLDVMLRDLAQYYEDRLDMQRRIRRIMAYPVFQLIIAWFLGTFSLRIVNQVVGLFSARGGGSFNLEVFVIQYIWFQVKAMLAVAVVFGACIALSRLKIAYVWTAITTYIWPMSAVVRKFALARFFRSLSLLIGSGLNITQCIQNAAAVMVNPFIERDLLQAIPRIKAGATLAQAFSTSRYLTPMAREMLFVGEQSGELEKQLRKASEYYLNEASHSVHIATKLAGILITLAVALVIGYIIISFYGRLYGGMFDAIDL